MELSHLITFVLISSVFVISPGPNVIVIISTSLQAGKKRGLQTVMGTSVAQALQLAIAAIGTAWFLSLLSQGLFWLKWCGVFYLLYLGITSLRSFLRDEQGSKSTAVGSFQRGFWTSLTNPKTILFFSAFLPQFVTDSASYIEQITLLSIVFWLVAIVFDSLWALLAGQTKKLFAGRDITRIENGISGGLYIAASGLLASSNRV
ncbi:MAG: LysE family translocator [Pseudomonadales bacterium]|nr:LysE family translocator [Pseudomonadales bacterium]